MKEALLKIIDKGLSGRYAITIIVGIVFAYVSMKGIIPAEAIVLIITTVVRDYFQRTDRAPEKNGTA